MQIEIQHFFLAFLVMYLLLFLEAKAQFTEKGEKCGRSLRQNADLDNVDLNETCGSN